MKRTYLSESTKIEILEKNSLIDIKKQNVCSKDLVVIDPPFEWDAKSLMPWINHAVRICKPTGNIAIFNKSITLDNQRYEINKKIRSNVKYNLFKDLRLRDLYTVENTTTTTRINAAALSTMQIAVYNKDLADRTIYVNRNYRNKKFYSPEKFDVVNDLWLEKKHKPGYHGTTNYEGEKIKVTHSTATAEWVIEKLIYCYARTGDEVYDCFGGAGTVPKVCRDYNITCRSVELDNGNFFTMNSRIKDKHIPKTFAVYAHELSRISYELACKHRTDSGMGSGIQRSIENGEQNSYIQCALSL